MNDWNSKFAGNVRPVGNWQLGDESDRNCRALVAQVCNLPYRRFSTCEIKDDSSAIGFSKAPTAGRRYSKPQVGATTCQRVPALIPRWGNNPNCQLQTGGTLWRRGRHNLVAR